MASTMNPLERKARASFIKGFFIALLIGILIIAFLALQLFNKITEEKKRVASQKTVLVLKKNVTSGEILTSNMFTTLKVDAEMAPTGSVDSVSKFNRFMVADLNGNEITTLADGSKVITVNGQQYPLTKDANGDYTYALNGQSVKVAFGESTFVAKISLGKGTPIIPDMVTVISEQATNDLREQEYNMIALPSDLKTDDTVDVRLRLPNGADYVVLSKKKVKVPEAGGNQSYSTVSLNLNETEILLMSAAIIDYYKIQGSKIYINKYTDPGLQKASIFTYIPSEDALRVINKDPNQLAKAKAALVELYQTSSEFRKQIDGSYAGTDQTTLNGQVSAGTTSEVNTQINLRKQIMDGK